MGLGFDLAPRLRQGVLYGLEVGDARAELAPLVHVWQREVERPLRKADHLRACRWRCTGVLCSVGARMRSRRGHIHVGLECTCGVGVWIAVWTAVWFAVWFEMWFAVWVAAWVAACVAVGCSVGCSVGWSVGCSVGCSAPMPMRPSLRMLMAYLYPCPTSPRTSSAGTRTPSRRTW